ncbi:MAG: hypothetical protein L6V81_03205 [Clostridium sp.]|nr:MAG: hypothetical protein L6V81_03205 [Clostridium sp.]
MDINLKMTQKSTIIFSNLYKDYIYYGVSNGEDISLYRYNIYNNEKEIT